MQGFVDGSQKVPESFNASKTGVKGLVDSGITKIPTNFIHEGEAKLFQPITPLFSEYSNINIPIINIDHIDENPIRRREMVAEIRDASGKWGVFQIINHGIPMKVMDETIDSVRRFHEQDSAVKAELFSRDRSNRLIFSSDFGLKEGRELSWKDTLEYVIAPPTPTDKHEDIPLICREALLKYSEHVEKLGICLFELLSEAMGLETCYLRNKNCTEGILLIGNYYPPCPTPELTLGNKQHTDGPFLTILLQDQIGGLQVLNEDQWVDVPCVPGALVVNIADLLQLMSNDRFKSVHHRVLAKNIGPRISVACFFRPDFQQQIPKLFAPINELVSETNPPIYGEISFRDLIEQRNKKGLDGTKALSHFKLS